MEGDHQIIKMTNKWKLNPRQVAMEGKVIVESHNKANNRVATHAVHCSDNLENSIFSRTGMIYCWSNFLSVYFDAETFLYL